MCNRLWGAKSTQMATLLMLLVGVGFVTEALLPQTASAQTRIDLLLERQPNESYDSLVSRAVAAATTTVQTSFDQNYQLPNINVTVVGQNEGAIAPILSLQVTKPEWLSAPDAARWTKYYSSAKALLLFEVATSTPVGNTTPPRYIRRSFNGNPNGNSFSNGRERTFITPVQPNTIFPPTQNTQPGILNSIPGSVTPSPGSGLVPLPPTSAPALQPISPQVPIPPTF